MRQESGKLKEPAEKVVRDIRRATRKQYSAEEKIRIVLSGLRGEDSIAELGRRDQCGKRRRLICPLRGRDQDQHLVELAARLASPANRGEHHQTADRLGVL